MPCTFTDKEGTVGTFDHISSFNDLATGLIRNVAEERDRAPVLALLKRLEQISAPNAGVPKILLLLCAIARYSRWLPGQMYVELVRNAKQTVVDIQVDEGGLRERLCRKLTLAVPLDEFVETVRKLDAHTETPLKVTSYRRKDDELAAIELTMVVAVRALTLPPKEMTERVNRATISNRTSSRPPKPTRKKKVDVTPSILPLIRPDAAPPGSAAPTIHRTVTVSNDPDTPPISAVPNSQHADTQEIDEEWE